MSEKASRERVNRPQNKGVSHRVAQTPTRQVEESGPYNAQEAISNNDLSSFAQTIESLSKLDKPAQSRSLIQLQRSHGNRYVQRVVAGLHTRSAESQSKPATQPIVQRYQAGVTGHEGETEALREIGFSEDDAEKAYIGNWLRDFSQLIAFDDSFKTKAKKTVVPWIGLGEFGESFSLDDLGVYVPSEHMDNPLGGGTVEDPLNANKDFSHLSNRQTKAQKQLDSQAANYEAAAKKANLPEYIGRSKQSASNTLKNAYQQGRTDRPTGMRLMGEALHAVEDYFAHTNFTEIAIWVMAQEGLVKAKEALSKTHGMEMAGGMDASGVMPQLIAGTYKPGGNDMVSLLETVKTQLDTKQFIYAALKGMIRAGAINLATVTSALAKYGVGVPAGVIGGAGGAIGSGAVGLVEGASKGIDEGAASGEASGHAMGRAALGPMYGDALGNELAGIGHYLGAAEGMVEGAGSGLWQGMKSGAKKGFNAGLDTVGGAAGKGAAAATKFAGEVTIVGGKIVITAAVAEMLLTTPAIAAMVYGAIKILHALINEILDKMTAKQTAQAVKESPVDPKTGKQTVTHSVLAKDSPDNPIWKPSSALFKEAVKGVGGVLHNAWNMSVADSDVNAQIDQALDKYIAVPDHTADAWWRQPLLKEL